MCGPSRRNNLVTLDDDARHGAPQPQHSKQASAFQAIYPIHPLIVIACLPFIPKNCYLNRGFTVWFHLVAVAYVLTPSKRLARVQALLGISICLGWYASILLDFAWYQRPVFRLLYQNMPDFLTVYMFAPETNYEEEMVLKYDLTSILCMILSHVGDTIGHPFLAWYFWRKSGKPWLYTYHELGVAFLVSRMWSLVHCYYNDHGGMLWGLYYTGFDVYRMDCVQQWYPAYIAEGLYFGVLVWYKLINKSEQEIITDDNEGNNEKPTLVFSESAMESFLEEESS